MSFLSPLRRGDFSDDSGHLRSVSSSVLLFFAAALMGFLLFMHRLGIGGDNLDYLVYIRSLMAGDWHVIRGWRYPPGYPIFASLLMRLFRQEVPMILNDIRPFTIYFLHGVNVLCFAGSVAVFWSWASHRAAPRWIPFTAASLWAIHQLSAATASQIASEPLFLLLSMLALGCWRSLLEEQHSKAWGLLIAALLATTAAIFTRTAGLAIVVAAFLMAAWNWRKQSRPWLFLATCLVPLVFYGLYLLTTGQTTYIDIMIRGTLTEHQAATSLPARLVSNLLHFRLAVTDLLIPKVIGDRGVLWFLGWKALRTVYMYAMLGLLLFGWAVYLRRNRVTLDIVYTAVTVGMLAVQPYFEQRYLIPILPFLLVYWLTGLLVLFRGASRVAARPALAAWATRWAVLSLLAWSLAVNLFAGSKNWRNIVRLWNEPPWAPERYVISRETDFADFMTAAIWIGKHTPPHSFVYARKATFVELAARRHARDTGGMASAQHLWERVQSFLPDRPVYILYDSFSPRTSYGATRILVLDPMLKEHPDEFKAVSTAPEGTIVYEVQPPPEV